MSIPDYADAVLNHTAVKGIGPLEVTANLEDVAERTL